MELRRSAEDYLEAIYVLKKQKGMVRSIDVAHYLDYSKPSVSRAVNNLKAEGLLEMRPDGELVLTEAGFARAENVYERHTLLTHLFIALGVSPHVAAEDACLVEHAISEETFEKLRALRPRLKNSEAGGSKPPKAEKENKDGKPKDKDKKKKKKKKKDKKEE